MSYTQTQNNKQQTSNSSLSKCRVHSIHNNMTNNTEVPTTITIPETDCSIEQKEGPISPTDQVEEPFSAVENTEKSIPEVSIGSGEVTLSLTQPEEPHLDKEEQPTPQPVVDETTSVNEEEQQPQEKQAEQTVVADGPPAQLSPPQSPMSSPRKGSQKMKQLLENTKSKCKLFATKIKGLFSKKNSPRAQENATNGQSTEKAFSPGNYQLVLYSEEENRKRNFEAKMLLLYYLALSDNCPQFNQECKEQLKELSIQSLPTMDEYMVNLVLGQVINKSNFWEHHMNNTVDLKFLKEHHPEVLLAIEGGEQKRISQNLVVTSDKQRNSIVVSSEATSVVFQVADDGRIFVNIVDNTLSCA